MRDIFKPGELKQNIINIKKKSNIDSGAILNKSNMPSMVDNKTKDKSIKSTFVITNNKFISPKVVITILTILLLIIISFITYYFINLNKDNLLQDSSKNQESVTDLDKFEENLNKIESSSENIDSDEQDIEYPTIDFNVNL
jgi:uncharacterized membrane protein (DUF106 family)